MRNDVCFGRKPPYRPRWEPTGSPQEEQSLEPCPNASDKSRRAAVFRGCPTVRFHSSQPANRITGMDSQATRPDVKVFNYCVAFIDLLGQRAAMRGQSVLPQFKSGDEKQAFLSTFKDSVGAIDRLQRQAEELLVVHQPHSEFRARLSERDQADWDEMLRSGMLTQRWSDGLVMFKNLGDGAARCVTNGIFELIGTCGGLMLLGLTERRPIRGGWTLPGALSFVRVSFTGLQLRAPMNSRVRSRSIHGLRSVPMLSAF